MITLFQINCKNLKTNASKASPSGRFGGASKTIIMKNKSLRYITLFFSTLLLFAGCKKTERDINLNVSSVPGFFAPADNKYIKLKPAANLTETFEWDQAKAEDGSLVLYEVAFDQETGDFTNPFYTVVSDNRGVNNKLTLSHGELSRIASLGGSAFFQRKKFRWTVLSSKGTTVKKAAVSRIIDLERPGGFAVLPGTLYITGTATEGGANLASALKMMQVAPGVFEIFSKLKAGTYLFVDGITGTPNRYYTFNDAGINAIGVNGTTTFSGPDKVQRIILDFNNINAKSADIISIQMWYSMAGTFKTTLNYTNNGEWRSSGYVADWIPQGWAPLGEERYKYKMVYNDGTGNKDLWINSFFGDPPGQNVYPSTPDYRKVNLDKNDGSGFDWGWKMVMTAAPIGSTVDFFVTLRGSDPFYTQNYVKQ